MANERFRIIDFDETSTVNSDDYVLVDGRTAGTRKYNINSISGGGDLPESYAGLTRLLENESLVPDTDRHTLIGDFTTGYTQDIYKLDQQGTYESWGDTGTEALSAAFLRVCQRIATIERIGSLPESYAGLTTLLEDGQLTADTENDTLVGNFTTGYYGDIYVLDQTGERIPWGDTHATEFTSAFNNVCRRIATIERIGSLPESYAGLTTLLEDGGLVADTGQYTLIGNYATGYTQDIYMINEALERVPWGDTEQEPLSGAILEICQRIAALEARITALEHSNS